MLPPVVRTTHPQAFGVEEARGDLAGRKGQGIVLILIRTGILAQSGFSHGLNLPGTYLTGRERGCFVE